jgi:5-methylcytosine-specific restriction protein A
MQFQRRAQFRQVRNEPARENSSARGYGRRWQKYSQARLFANPLCVVCGRAAQATDHIQPVTGPMDRLFWDPKNHQSLCWNCHSRKTATETNGEALKNGSTRPKTID